MLRGYTYYLVRSCLFIYLFLRCGWWWEIGVDGNVVWLEESAWGWGGFAFVHLLKLIISGFNLFEPLKGRKALKIGFWGYPSIVWYLGPGFIPVNLISLFLMAVSGWRKTLWRCLPNDEKLYSLCFWIQTLHETKLLNICQKLRLKGCLLT